MSFMPKTIIETRTLHLTITSYRLQYRVLFGHIRRNVYILTQPALYTGHAKDCHTADEKQTIRLP